VIHRPYRGQLPVLQATVLQTGGACGEAEMASGNGGWRGRAGGRGRWRPQNRAVGCLLWIVGLLVVLLLLSVLFGGFQKGTKDSAGPAKRPGAGSVIGERAQPAGQELTLGGIAALR
jgi:hypothetical protein